MKIAYVITRSNEIGGAHVHVRDLASWFISQSHEACVFVGGTGVFTDALEEAGVPFVPLQHLKRPVSPVHDMLAVRELAEELKRYGPDIVSVHSAKAGIVGRLACRLAGVPCVFTAHGWSFTDGVKWPAKQLYRTLEKFLAPLAAAIVTVCRSDATLAINQKVAPPDKLVTIYNGMPELDSSRLKSTSSLRTVPTLVMVARFESQKDHATLIDALSLLKDLDWRLELVGDGPLMKSIHARVRDYGLDSNVAFLGRRRDVPSILEQSDIFVLSTNWEGFPRSILEAMRAGLPVVATEVAGIPESVEHDVTGYVVPQGDEKVLAERLRALITSQELRTEMGSAGRKSFSQHFTFERMALDTQGLYQRLLSGKK